MDESEEEPRDPSALRDESAEGSLSSASSALDGLFSFSAEVGTCALRVVAFGVTLPAEEPTSSGGKIADERLPLLLP